MAAGPIAVGRRLGEFGREFLDSFQAINAVRERLRRISTLPVSVSTITFTGKLDCGGVPVEDMRMNAALAEEFGPPLEFSLDCDATKRRKTAAGAAGAAAGPGKRFRYQLSLKRRGKSVKVFHNGSVHATGCTSPLEFLDLAAALLEFIEETGEVRARLLDFDIHLINVLFLVTCPRTGRPMTIAPKALLDHMGAARADFDTERHPSVKIAVRDDAGAKVATACVFQTGSVSIMGAKRPRHLALAYATVCEALEACAEAVCAPDPAAAVRTTTAKNALTLHAGYPLGPFSCCQF